MSEHPGLEIVPQTPRSPNFTLEALSSVIYKLYANNSDTSSTNKM